MQQPQMPNIELSNTQGLVNDDGGSLFLQGVIIRTVSRFLMGTDEDAMMPIPVFVCSESGKIVGEGLPPELREEYKDQTL